jgi:hypothetical protein
VEVLAAHYHALLDPNTGLLEFKPGFNHLGSETCPFHVRVEDVNRGAWLRIGVIGGIDGPQEFRKSRLGHLVILDRHGVGGLPLVGDIVGGIGDDEIGEVAAHEFLAILLFGRVPA